MIEIINACTDLGVSVVGSELGPIKVLGYVESDKRIKKVHTLGKPNVIKSIDKADRKKNISGINLFNTALYHKILEVMQLGSFPITIGGDHSIGIATSLAVSKASGENIGLIWIDAFADYNTFETSLTGNLHGIPLATVNGINGNELTGFHEGRYFDPKKTVLIGARDFDPSEYENLIQNGVTVFTTKDILAQGIDNVITTAMNIANNGTTGVHVSLDISVTDPFDFPAVSTPAQDGLERAQLFELLTSLFQYKDRIKGFDLAEYNPMRDNENKSYIIMINVIEKLINSLKD